MKRQLRNEPREIIDYLSRCKFDFSKKKKNNQLLIQKSKKKK